MDIRKGMFRFWVVVSLVWFSGIMVSYYGTIRSEFERPRWDEFSSPVASAPPIPPGFELVHPGDPQGQPPTNSVRLVPVDYDPFAPPRPWHVAG